MKLAYKISLVLLLVGLISVGSDAKDRHKEFTKTIKKEFDITRDGKTSIKNKYGKVDIKVWEKNRVKVDVRIVVNASTESKAQEVFDRIDVGFKNGSNYVSAETVIESKKSSWWGNWSSSKSDYTINYEVYLPQSNSVNVTNKYGDVYVAELDGQLDVELKYGNFKLDGVNADANLNLAYGNGTLVKARDVDIEASYAKLRLKEINDTEIRSKYSTFQIERADDIRSYSKYDNYDIGEVKEFRNEGKYDDIDIDNANNVIIAARYTEVYINNIAGSLDLDFEYGGASVQKLSKGFSDVRLNGKYTDFKLNLESGAVYRMEASADYAGIRYPSAMTVTYEQDKNNSHQVEGHSGTQNAPSVIKARLNYGGLKVRQE